MFPGLLEHSESFSPIECIAVGVDRMQPNFEPMRKAWTAPRVALASRHHAAVDAKRTRLLFGMGCGMGIKWCSGRSKKQWE